MSEKFLLEFHGPVLATEAAIREALVKGLAINDVNLEVAEVPSDSQIVTDEWLQENTVPW